MPEPAPRPRRFSKLGILGAGFMGAGIASIAAQQGTLIRLKDADLGRVGKGLAAAREVLRDRLTKKQITRQQLDDYMSLIGGTIDYSGFRNVDLVIEAVFEDLGVKQAVLQETEAVTRADAIFASNTSTIPIARLASVSSRPQRVIGMHFFSPVPKMPLLEVIVTPQTSREVTTTVVGYGKTLGKTVIVVNDAPGFFANRILAPYINEAGILLDEGVAIDAIDRALVEFGFPVGPITLIDEVGLDIAGKSGAIMLEAFGSRMAPSQSLTRVVAAGRTGRKGKKGFYRYDENGKKRGVDPSVYELLPTGQRRIEVPVDEIQRRCVLAMVNEAVRCLQEGILRSSRDGDVGAVFGIGFPPFRGGPFRYVDSLGAERVVRALEGLNTDRAPRFAPAQLLIEMAREGRRFYPERGHPSRAKFDVRSLSRSPQRGRMLRKTLLYLSNQQRVFTFVRRNRLARRMASRFVAGETIDEAIPAVRALNARGITASLDLLGESVHHEEEARATARAYLEILDRIQGGEARRERVAQAHGDGPRCLGRSLCRQRADGARARARLRLVRSPRHGEQ